MSKREAAELVMIEQNVTLDLSNNKVMIRYPAKGDLNHYLTNFEKLQTLLTI
jgi:hypothetical protein